MTNTANRCIDCEDPIGPRRRRCALCKRAHRAKLERDRVARSARKPVAVRKAATVSEDPVIDYTVADQRPRSERLYRSEYAPRPALGLHELPLVDLTSRPAEPEISGEQEAIEAAIRAIPSSIRRDRQRYATEVARIRSGHVPAETRPWGSLAGNPGSSDNPGPHQFTFRFV